MKTLLKIIIALISAAIVIIAVSYIFFIAVTKDAALDVSKLTNYGRSISILDNSGKEIASTSLFSKRKSVQLKDLKDETISAFIASEDRTFYKHSGLNYKRMAKALIKNITSRSFKEGASTISQQLIKNTHLTGDKTIKRKLNEIKLTRQLEKNYSKDEILEMYLNTIYFGHNCYGLESASEFYFGKPASLLTTEQSATMAGLLTSPNNYSPFRNPEKCLARRNIVLKCMHECNFLSNIEYEKAKAAPLSAEKNGEVNSDDYLNAVFDELEDLEIDYYRLSDGCKIKTHLDTDLQKYIENLEYGYDNSVIVTSKDGGVKAYKSTIGDVKRQPGSTIKPILVYAPAIEEKIISPDSKILDEKVNFGGYSPENYDKQYHGYVTVAESIAKSYNIPAVKTLNSLTLDKAEKYAGMCDIAINKDEKNLSLALGGMKYGLSLKEICDRYSIFANQGNYSKSHFIDEIKLKDGTVVYKSKIENKNVFGEGTCSLINDMLIKTSKDGTAKKLKELPFDVAAKTGTCGNAAGNTDAYCISYTSRDTIGVWLGDKDNNPIQITGGGNAANITRQILEKIYSDNTPPPLEVNVGTNIIQIDRDEYNKNNNLILADDASPKLAVKEIKILRNNTPKTKSDKFSHPTINKPTILTQNNDILIRLCQTYYYSYLVERQNNGKKITVYDGEWTAEIKDTPESGNNIYYVTPYFKNEDKIYYGETIQLPPVNLSSKINPPQKEVPDILHREWYNE